MKKLSIFLSSFALILETICLYIDCNLFYNTGIFIDEHNFSAAEIRGGEGWLIGEWFILFALALLIVLTAALLIISIRWTVSSRKDQRKKQ